ncbi:MAG: phage shock protein operon transcriptional activator [Rhodothalassiaceae bacterium]
MAQHETQILGQAPAFLDLMDQISRVAPLARPVLVIGERGTGKEMVAQRLHFLSPRWERPLVKLNCAAIPETLLESELFGVEPGAFTGATRRRPGRFEQAHSGTLFLDEIGTLSMAAQEKLLRVIEYGELERVGGTETIDVNVRLVGATNVDLPALAAAGKFRADLLDRLAFDVLTVPPLRARLEDIVPLANFFARRMEIELGRDGVPQISPEAFAKLAGHDWPGNVRELKNVVERAVYRGEDGVPVAPEDIVFDPFDSPFRPGPAPGTAPQPNGLPDPRRPFDLKAALRDTEAKLVAEAFDVCRHHQGDTAEHLGLSYDQIRHLLKKHGIAR